MNDYEQFISDLQDAINDVESLDCVDVDIEGLVAEALIKLEAAKLVAEERV